MTMHRIASGTYEWFHGVDGAWDANAANGDTFVLTADNNTLSIGGGANSLSNNAVFVYGSKDSVSLSYPGAGDHIYDRGQGTQITINECAAPSLDHMVKISGFQNDPTGLLRISDANWLHSPTPALRPDGHGGTLVGAFVDLLGDAHVNPAQVQCFRPMA